MTKQTDIDLVQVDRDLAVLAAAMAAAALQGTPAPISEVLTRILRDRGSLYAMIVATSGLYNAAKQLKM